MVLGACYLHESVVFCVKRKLTVRQSRENERCVTDSGGKCLETYLFEQVSPAVKLKQQSCCLTSATTAKPK